jgi:hypothetical protein
MITNERGKKFQTNHFERKSISVHSIVFYNLRVKSNNVLNDFEVILMNGLNFKACSNEFKFVDLLCLT